MPQSYSVIPPSRSVLLGRPTSNSAERSLLIGKFPATRLHNDVDAEVLVPREVTELSVHEALDRMSTRIHTFLRGQKSSSLRTDWCAEHQPLHAWEAKEKNLITHRGGVFYVSGTARWYLHWECALLYALAKRPTWHNCFMSLLVSPSIGPCEILRESEEMHIR